MRQKLSRPTRTKQLKARKTTVRLPDDLLGRLEAQADAECASVSTVMRRLLLQGLQRIERSTAA